MPSRLQLTVAATVAVHLLGAVVVDVLGVVSKTQPKPPPPRISMVDIDVASLRPPPPEEPPPEEPAPPEPTAPPPPVTQPTQVIPPRARVARTTTRTTTATETNPATSSTPTDNPTPNAGGQEVYSLPDLGTSGGGPKMAVGKRQTATAGRGGSGGGTGTGTGTGDSPGVAPITSIAAIKTPAKPIGDFDYFDARKLYPAEAKAQGVAGTIRAKLEVDATGKVRSVKLLNRLGHGLDELAEKRARALTFAPARDADDRAVASIVVWRFTFELPE